MAEETGTPAPAAPKPAAPAGRSADEILSDPIVASAVASVRDAVVDAKEFAGEITVIAQRARIRDVASAFKDAGFHYLVDLTAVDYSKYPAYAGDRFAVVYHLYSHAANARVRLKAFTPETEQVPSVTGVWKTANWFEREAFDMFGVVFEGHPNLERILMWEGFNGHPLRKDFPIRGIDTGARIYPEVFAEGEGPKPGSTGKDPKDVNLFNGEWPQYGRSPVVPAALPPAPPKPAGGAADHEND